jgi:hypothetical protein
MYLTPRTAFGWGLKSALDWHKALVAAHEATVRWREAWMSSYRAFGMEAMELLVPNPLSAEIKEGFRKLRETREKRTNNK